jgi:hypothetical protein
MPLSRSKLPMKLHPIVGIHDKSLSRKNGDFPAPGLGTLAERPREEPSEYPFALIAESGMPARTAVKAERCEFILSLDGGSRPH